MNKVHYLSDVNVLRIQKEFGIPVDSMFPRTYWIISLDRESRLPSDVELAQISSYCEFSTRNIYRPEYAQKIFALPLPKEAGHNTVVFKKGSSSPSTEKHWFRRKMSWENPIYAPSVIAEDYRGLSLIEVVDSEQDIIPEKWERWKTKHIDIFPIQQAPPQTQNRN